MLSATTAILSLSLAQGLPERPPQLYTFFPPQGNAAGRSDIVGIVREILQSDESPESYADRVAAQLLSRLTDGTLPIDKICILPQNVGQGGGGDLNNGDLRCDSVPALFKAFCDGVVHQRNIILNGNLQCGFRNTLACENILHTAELNNNWWNTPWMKAGIVETRDFMEPFVARLQSHLTNAGVPAPARFHCDTEERPHKVQMPWPQIQEDARYDEPLRSFPGLTLRESYLAAGEPNYDLPDGAWTNWMEPIILTQADNAMDAAVYSVVKNAWPKTLCSNYGTSWRTSEDRPLVSGRWLPIRPRCYGVGDLQAPVLYAINGNWIDTPHDGTPILESETLNDARIRIQRFNIEQLAYSLRSDQAPSEITPWVLNIGQDYETGDGLTLVDKPALREQLAMLRSKGVHEILVWNDEYEPLDREANWNQSAQALDQAWQYKISSHSVMGGTTNESVDALRYALQDHFDGEATMQLTGLASTTILQATFENSLPNQPNGQVEVYIEASSPIPGTQLYVGTQTQSGPSSGWTWAAPFELLGDVTRRKVVLPSAPPAGDSNVRVQVLVQSPPYVIQSRADIDMIQVVGAD